MDADEAKRQLDGDKALRIGASHGADAEQETQSGYARDIGPEGLATETGIEARTQDAGLKYPKKQHPGVRLDVRARGYGIGGGYERPYRREKAKEADESAGLYGPMPHSGYYGTGEGLRPFKVGQASFREELDWYRSQYGEKTSGFEKEK